MQTNQPAQESSLLKTTSTLAALSAIALAGALLLGCENEGPAEESAEQVGQQIDQAAEETREAMDEVGERASEAAEQAGDKIESATD
jgi:hypothetical protein